MISIPTFILSFFLGHKKNFFIWYSYFTTSKYLYYPTFIILFLTIQGSLSALPDDSAKKRKHIQRFHLGGSP